ncbi:MAG: hypothetical protein Q8O86_10080 [Dehalococcoidia bacterium]|nr:hypothetical protein [Dehalococcoidia bacterium]
MATNVATTTLYLDFSRVPRGDKAYVIVRASDGFNAVEDASDAPFTAGPRAVFLPFLAKVASGW